MHRVAVKQKKRRNTTYCPLVKVKVPQSLDTRNTENDECENKSIRAGQRIHRTLAGSVLALHEARAKAVESVSFVPARGHSRVEPPRRPGSFPPLTQSKPASKAISYKTIIELKLEPSVVFQSE